MPKNVHRLPRKAPTAAQLEAKIHKLAAAGQASFALEADNEKIVGGCLDVSQALEVLSFGEVTGEVTPGPGAGEWLCQVVSSLELRSAYAAVETVVVRDQILIVKSARWLG